jgi:hypothetical protein
MELAAAIEAFAPVAIWSSLAAMLAPLIALAPLAILLRKGR